MLGTGIILSRNVSGLCKQTGIPRLSSQVLVNERESHSIAYFRQMSVEREVSVDPKKERDDSMFVDLVIKSPASTISLEVTIPNPLTRVSSKSKRI